MQELPKNTYVSYQYRRHYLIGGGLVSGYGRVIDSTVIGTELGYIIKPADGSDCVHVPKSGVSECVHEPVSEDLWAASFTFCKHCNKQL